MAVKRNGEVFIRACKALRGFLVGALSLLLVGGICLQGSLMGPNPHGGSRGHLAAVLPAKIVGWTDRNLPLGATEILTRTAENELRHDDYICRSYVKNGKEFALYVGYWKRGLIPARLVASHSPDRCFPASGMVCVEQAQKHFSPYSRSADDLTEWRKFMKPNMPPVYVLYWHRVGGSSYDYKWNCEPAFSPVSWLQDALQQVKLGSGEQYFVRLTSAVPFEELFKEDGFVKIFEAAKRLGFAEYQKTEEQRD